MIGFIARKLRERRQRIQVLPTARRTCLCRAPVRLAWLSVVRATCRCGWANHINFEPGLPPMRVLSQDRLQEGGVQ